MKRSLVFWLWNDLLEKEKICRQICDFKKQGVEGFFIHPMPSEFRPADFPGGMPGYLSKHYLQMVRAAVECAAEADMEVWLYDEAGWPSGTLNGYFRDHRPDLMHRQINADGTFSFNGFCPDLLNPETTNIFISQVHEKYREYLEEFFGSTIPGIFTDEPSFGAFRDNTLPFSPVLEKSFAEIKGYSAKDAAMRIFQTHDEKAALDFYEVWLKLIRESFLLPIRDWCHRNQLLFTGHFNGDDCINNALTLLTGDLRALHDCLDIPGCDAIWRQIHPLMPETDFTRMTVSAAGNKRTISETFAVYGTDLSLAEMKQVAAMQFIAGIGMIAPMAMHYSDEGGRQITTVSNLFGADPRWRNYRHFADFSRRMSKVFDRTSPVIKASVPFPLELLRTGKADPQSIFPAGLALARKQITYDYSQDAVTLPENITPDVALRSPEPMLRTRHLRSPRGERRIFANAGLEPISVRFTAPAAYNAWYDPATGKHFAAVADADGSLSLDLPFAGIMVLLSIPGRAAQRPGIPAAETTRLPLDFRFARITRTIQASPHGLTEVPDPDIPGEFFCGTIVYEAQVDLPQSLTATVTLPGALRAMCTLSVNGQSITQVWPPYRWQLSLDAGRNTIVLEVANTPAPAMNAPEHLAYLRKNRFDNAYFNRCAEFEKLFPGEDPLAGAYMEY